MKLEQLYTNCLAHAAYYLESDGEAALFDPLRETDDYIEKAANDHAKIKYIFETHFHADFVSGHLDLARKTDASIVYGPTAKPKFKAIIGNDGELFSVGKCRVKLIHTPGHTMESSCYLITDEQGVEKYLISGDTLFIGDVGRPDLAQHVIADLTQEKLAGFLYDSLRNKIMTLSDDLIVYPNHGAGSACGKMMSKETFDTLGNQKKHNYALRPDMSKQEFIKEVLSGLTTPPGYFPKNVILNISGYTSFDEVLSHGKKALAIEDFVAAFISEKAVILDTRDAEKYAESSILGSLNIGLNGSFASWVGELIPDIKQPILLVVGEGKETEAITRLARIGYDNCLGYLEGGMEIWEKANKAIQQIQRFDPEELRKMNASSRIIDVRKQSEFESQHIVGAENYPLNRLQEQLKDLPKETFLFLICAGGYRSMIAASILAANGFKNIGDIRGGMTEALKQKVPVTSYVCPNTML
jgi:hydroxyacylglutathione hydrolase